MEAIKNVTHSLKKVSESWNISLNFFSNYLNGETKSKKMGPTSLLTEEKHVTIVAWILGMHECGFSIPLQRLKIKVVELTQTKPPPFKHRVPRKTWWHWFS
jgi:hypothetical protein